MQLDSYLEIFTTMYGWAFANIIGEVIVGTGLIVLPFALIVFNAWRDAKEHGTAADGIIPVIEAVTAKLVIAMFVMSVCFATTPATSLLSLNLSYKPSGAGGAAATAVEGSLKGGTKSGYDTAMADASDGSMSTSGNLAYVPAWWYTVMAISSGASNAIRNAVKSTSTGVRQVEEMARVATIEDPKLLGEVQRFYSECFVPARSRYLRMAKSEISPDGAAVLATGAGDVDWAGSQFYRKEPGFYDTMRSYNPVPGFAVDFARDTDYIQTPAAAGTPEASYRNPVWGRPTCGEWWITPKTGVRDQMIDSTSTWRKLLSGAESGSGLSWFNAEERKDAFARLALTKANPTFVDADRIMGNDHDQITSMGRIITGAASTFGLAKKALEASMAMVPLMNGLPMLQALVLMGLYMFLPLIVFLSGFDLKVMLVGAIGIFTVKFWSVMWFIANWVDAHLIAALYPGQQGNIIIQELTQMANGSTPPSYKRMLLNVLLMLMFVGLPVLWTGMMSWIGIRIAAGVGDMVKAPEGIATSAASSSIPGGKGRRMK